MTDAIDWKALKRRVSAAASAAESGGALSEAQTRRILAQRARDLARADDSNDGRDDILRCVEISAGGARFALPLQQLAEVRGAAALTPVPCTPGFIAGIINLRGQIVAVIALQILLDLPVQPAGRAKIAVLQADGRSVGLLFDDIAGLYLARRADLQSDVAALGSASDRYRSGIDGARVIILDAEKILGDPALIVGTLGRSAS